MNCITKEDEGWSTTIFDQSNHTCYYWDASKDYKNMEFTVKQCLHGDQICDVFSQSDQSDYTLDNFKETKGNFREQIVSTDQP